MKIYLFFLIFLLPSHLIFSQTFVSGNVYTENQIPLPGVLIVNVDTDAKSFSDQNGHFTISGSDGNELRFVRQNYERVALKINSGNFLLGLNVIMIFLPTDIEEVKIAPKLSGDLSKDSNSLTKVDRLAQLNKDLGLPKAPEKMREKPSDFKKDLIGPLLSTMPAINVQALYNIVSGKARRQKRLYKYDDFQEKIIWLQLNLRPDFFKENKIKQTEISEFLTFALLENEDLNNGVKSKNIRKAEFILLGLIPEYLNRRT